MALGINETTFSAASGKFAGQDVVEVTETMKTTLSREELESRLRETNANITLLQRRLNDELTRLTVIKARLEEALSKLPAPDAGAA